MRFLLLLLYIPLLLSAHSESSYPYISGYTWWHFCDWKLTEPDFGKSTYSKFDPNSVQLGDTVFVEYNCLEEFAKDYLPQIKNRFILITGNYGYGADMPLPGPHFSILKNENIAAWFVQNIDRLPTENLIPMPIGLASNYWPHGNNSLLDYLIPHALENEERSIFIYVNFSVAPERVPCANHFTLLGVKGESRKSYADYLQDLSQSVFVISPPGGGLDCHRTWEALLLGCYPVVQSTTLNPLYEDLPVVIIQDWAEVTHEFLEEKYRELKSKKWSRDKLYFSYWVERIRTLQEKLRNTSFIPDAVRKKIEFHTLSNSWRDAYYDVLPKVIKQHNYQSILEVGVALGGHAETILNNTNITSYIGVDPYRCYDPSDGFQQDVSRYSSLDPQQNFDYLYQWVKNVRLSVFEGRFQLFRKTASEASQELEDASLDCIFIDGDHNYETVLKDLEALFPKLKTGHLMIGDDYSMPAVARAVNDFFDFYEKELFFFESASGYKLWAVYK